MAYEAELESAAEGARRAGALLLGQFRRPAVGVRLKQGDSREPVSAADMAADDLLRDHIAAHHPADAVLTEETPQESRPAARRWVLDPLDGTTNFLAGIPFWAISIALETEGECMLATVYDPMRDELHQSAEGHPTTCNGKPASVSAVSGLESAVAAVLLTPADASRPEVVRLKSGLRAARELGATSLELAWVAQGRLDLCLFRRNERVWDWLAGARLVRDAGGKVTAWGTTIPGAAVAASAVLGRASQPDG